jgi:predicted alpha/beta superfamily hydrolase
MVRYGVVILFALMCLRGQAARIVIDSVPQLTPLFEPLFISGTFNQWQPADSAYRLQQTADGHWFVDIAVASETPIEFKFTRGDWEQAEATDSGDELQNRTCVLHVADTLHLSIVGWRDLPGVHTVNGNVRILSTRFPMPYQNAFRRVWIYLPNNYSVSKKSYPVWYFQDGQNLFDRSTSFAGEWHLDENASALEAAGCEPGLIVGIDNGGELRMPEYSPFANERYAGSGAGDAYLHWLFDELKPFVDSHFRTMPGPETTGIAGSSLGGLIAAYAVNAFPDQCAKAILYSPSIWLNASALLGFTQQQSPSAAARIYMVGGQNESASMVNDMVNLRNAWVTSGLAADQVAVVVDPDGQHNEASWDAQTTVALEWTMQCGSIDIQEEEQSILVFPNPTTDNVCIALPDRMNIRDVAVRDAAGKEILHLTGNQLRWNISLAPFSQGSYTLVVIDEGGTQRYIPIIKK